MSFLDKFSKEEICDVVSGCDGFASALRQLGVSTTSSVNRIILSQYVKDNNINIDHFAKPVARRTPSDIFIEHSTAAQSTMRRYYKRGEYSEYKCAICGLLPEWNGKELVLTLDHINGVNDDHRLENLRWICPNCDMQLPTHGNKGKKAPRVCEHCDKELPRKRKYNLCRKCAAEVAAENKSVRNPRVCKICGAAISKDATYCTECYPKTRMKVERPSDIDLAKMIVEDGFSTVGKRFGVNGNTIVKWCKAYGLPCYKKELVDWYNSKMGIVPESKPARKTIDEIVKPIKQIDMQTGAVLNVFANQADALRHLGKKSHSNHISQVCRGLRKSAYGYFWQYADS